MAKNGTKSGTHSVPNLGSPNAILICFINNSPDLGPISVSPGDPDLGSDSVPPGPHFSAPPSFPGLSLVEAFASWRWFNYLVSQVPAGKRALLINMDETLWAVFVSSTEEQKDRGNTDNLLKSLEILNNQFF